MIDFKDKKVKDKFDTYPSVIKEKLLALRELIFEVAHENSIDELEETLKWNEPSYLSEKGSTIRINSKKSNPDKYSIYFNCNTKLVSTFRKLFDDRFSFVGNREIEFYINDSIDIESLKYCILLSLTYHERKHFDMLEEEKNYHN